MNKDLIRELEKQCEAFMPEGGLLTIEDMVRIIRSISGDYRRISIVQDCEFICENSINFDKADYSKGIYYTNNKSKIEYLTIKSFRRFEEFLRREGLSDTQITIFCNQGAKAAVLEMENETIQHIN